MRDVRRAKQGRSSKGSHINFINHSDKEGSTTYDGFARKKEILQRECEYPSVSFGNITYSEIFVQPREHLILYYRVLLCDTLNESKIYKRTNIKKENGKKFFSSIIPSNIFITIK